MLITNNELQRVETLGYLICKMMTTVAIFFKSRSDYFCLPIMGFPPWIITNSSASIREFLLSAVCRLVVLLQRLSSKQCGPRQTAPLSAV